MIICPHSVTDAVLLDFVVQKIEEAIEEVDVRLGCVAVLIVEVVEAIEEVDALAISVAEVVISDAEEITFFGGNSITS